MNDKFVTQPEDLSISLYPHQLLSIYKMEKIEKHFSKEDYNNLIETKIRESNIGLLSDIAGYGKTLSMIALILRDKQTWKTGDNFVLDNIKSFAGGRFKSIIRNQYEILRSTLILASKSIVKQWFIEFKYAKNLKIKLVSCKQDLINLNPNNMDVLIVIPKYFNQLIKKFKNFAWKRFIFDEPGHIRVPNMYAIVAGFYWFVCSSPNLIINKHINCRNSLIRDIIDIGKENYIVFNAEGTNNYINSIFNNNIVKNCDDFVRKSFKLPPSKHFYYKCQQTMLNTVKGLTNDKIIELLEAGDIKNVIKLLGGCENSNIVDLLKKRKYDELEIVRSTLRLCEIRGGMTQMGSNDNRIMELKNKEITIIANIKEIDVRVNLMLKSLCCICHQPLNKPVLEPNCQNIFCGLCLYKWLQKKENCPLCRNSLQPKELIYLTSSEAGDTKNEVDEKKCDKNIIPTKEQIIIKIINNINKQIIIFSNYDATFDRCKKFLIQYNITFTELKGRLSQINNSLELFKLGKIQVILLNSISNGAGLNLQCATDLILYHKMNEDIKSQIIGRANRIGRTTNLNIHHLI